MENQELKKLRLTGKDFENFTGQMGVMFFKDGLSVNGVLKIDAHRIAGAIGAEWEDGTPAHVNEVYAASLQVPAPTGLQGERRDVLAAVVGLDNAVQAERQISTIANLQFDHEGVQKVAEVADTDEKTEVQTTQTESQTAESQEGATTNAAAATQERKYTRTELEEIADKEGFAALREIGNTVGVKSGSINGLIDAIMKVAGAVEA